MRVGRGYDMIESHTDVVGSLLRPATLLDARQSFAAGRIGGAAFKMREDRAVDEAVALQEEAGLDIVTDGEMRRLSFQSQMTQAVDGFGEWDIDAFMWGAWRKSSACIRRAVSGRRIRAPSSSPNCRCAIM